jgi:hypothetical protein
MKKVYILMLILIGTWMILSAGPGDTSAQEAEVRAELISWLDSSTFVNIDYSDVDKIVAAYNSDYIRKVMNEYVMPFPSGSDWNDFLTEYFPLAA